MGISKAEDMGQHKADTVADQNGTWYRNKGSEGLGFTV